ncbi:uncharacterized protein LOC118309522 isoform X1 [Scophthalmus maximus]|uniref:uncharacterized protein LOC118309522 isoform X1 n=2 Tax=Scophthalmus maximus TaxID=52904 RepID=UPI0015E097E3|nr:uncharacterized protein LOC118309522 isoform X1 [Scophthalmus maximus]XP_035487633.1 uncharacterized protein LOC118309522 isoform X1 [Scophthalmus maximus]XP_035487634.1 uncharacterized protein LOC118309522 isoform X1 [Scophthalmus maximus]XP_035487635.1 uncharacterized protein LOC118309522 isoform X1 [Scophthalmus maximus]XP_047188724.1 uncharacterized protein LOC118309522 isoform X1 [Scophthalmus maximus]XP_047188725.1 uncharacterized protein LOC118309522 isoform X1 [Scophthalmus maximus]
MTVEISDTGLNQSDVHGTGGQEVDVCSQQQILSTAMVGVVEGAALLCACKLACSLLFLPSLTTSYSPVSFCCCCLLIFTDFLVTVFLSLLCVFESWVTAPTLLGDVIALRFLLFLSHTYGTVLLLTTPLIAVETLTRLLLPPSVVPHRAASQSADDDGQHCYTGEEEEEEEEEEEDSSNPDKDKDKVSSHVVGYLCCLSVWVVVALDVRWRWKLQEEWAAACLHKTNSFIRCLPNLFSPVPSAVNPCWGMAFLSLLLVLLTTSTGLLRRRRSAARTEGKPRTKRGLNNNGDSCRQDLAPARSAPSTPVNRGMSVSESAQRVDPEKTESSCTVHRTYPWNIVQMLARHHGDFVLISPGCLSAERGGRERDGTKRGTPLTLITAGHEGSQRRGQFGRLQWGFPCLWLDVMIGSVSVLAIFVLPLNLSVNILLIRTIEILLELFVRSVLSYAANKSDTSDSYHDTLV